MISPIFLSTPSLFWGGIIILWLLSLRAKRDGISHSQWQKTTETTLALLLLKAEAPITRKVVRSFNLRVLHYFIISPQLTVLQPKMEFRVRVPSFLYANRTEGLCGVCAGYQDVLVTSNGTETEDFDEVCCFSFFFELEYLFSLWESSRQYLLISVFSFYHQYLCI